MNKFDLRIVIPNVGTIDFFDGDEYEQGLRSYVVNGRPFSELWFENKTTKQYLSTKWEGGFAFFDDMGKSALEMAKEHWQKIYRGKIWDRNGQEL